MESITLNLNSPVLAVEGLSVARSGNLIIDNLDLTINKGEFVGLVGPNGSGKSTLLLAILGIIKSHKGNVSIYGSQPLSPKLNGKIGWVSQAASHLPEEIRITVEELVKLGTISAKNMFFRRSADKKKIVDDAIEMVGLTEKRGIDVSKLSGGQKQRAVIARALASNADFIVLDEPLVGVDRDSRNSLLKLLDDLCHQQNKTILMVSHDFTAIRKTSHRMIYLEDGIQFDGPAADFPSLDELATLRGIKNVHSDHNHIDKEDL